MPVLRHTLVVFPCSQHTGAGHHIYVSVSLASDRQHFFDTVSKRSNTTLRIALNPRGKSPGVTDLSFRALQRSQARADRGHLEESRRPLCGAGVVRVVDDEARHRVECFSCTSRRENLFKQCGHGNGFSRVSDRRVRTCLWHPNGLKAALVSHVFFDGA